MSRATRIEPGPGQESVWDYPRPPKLESVSLSIEIVFNSVLIAQTCSAYRVLETSHPPVYYLPQDDIQMQFLRPASGSSFCEWKGSARYYTLQVEDKIADKVAWSYPTPTRNFAPIQDFIAFYAGPMDVCTVGDERVTPQPGGFYGGWITSNIVGPFKGSLGTMGW